MMTEKEIRDFSKHYEEVKYKSGRHRTILFALRCYPNVSHGKFYDYKIKPVDNHFEMYKREIEGDPWIFHCYFAIVDGMLYTNRVGNCAPERRDING